MASHGYAKQGVKAPTAPKMPPPTHESMVHHVHIDGPHHVEHHFDGDGMHHIQIHLHDGAMLSHNLPSNSETDKE